MVRTIACDLGPPGGFACERKAYTTHNSPHKMAPQRPSPWPPPPPSITSVEQPQLTCRLILKLIDGRSKGCSTGCPFSVRGGRAFGPSHSQWDMASRARFNAPSLASFSSLNADSANLVCQFADAPPVLSPRITGTHPSHFSMRWMHQHQLIIL